MKHNLLSFGLLSLGLSVSSLSSTAFAQSQAEIILKDSAALWMSRDQQSKVEDLIKLIQTNETEVAKASPQIQAELRMLHTKALNRKGATWVMDKKEKMAIFELAMDSAKKSAAAVDSADAKYYYAAALARWAEAKGIMASLGKKDELIANLNDAKTRNSLAGTSGEALEGYGPDRVLGKIYSKLPGFAGGNRNKALELTKKSYDKAPDYAANALYYAEVLSGGNATEKKTACDVLFALLAKNPADIGGDRVIETREEFAQAQELKGQICN